MNKSDRKKINRNGLAQPQSMNTSFLLMAQYGGKAIIPIEDVYRDYFPHLKPL